MNNLRIFVRVVSFRSSYKCVFLMHLVSNTIPKIFIVCIWELFIFITSILYFLRCVVFCDFGAEKQYPVIADKFTNDESVF